jgi:hypothetical protein
MRHTPGPWVAHDPHRDSVISINSADGRFIGHVYEITAFDRSKGVNEVAQANARLIAAAPAMLAALKELQIYLNGSFPTRAHAMMEEAIAQAEAQP